MLKCTAAWARCMAAASLCAFFWAGDVPGAVAARACMVENVRCSLARELVVSGACARRVARGMRSCTFTPTYYCAASGLNW